MLTATLVSFAVIFVAELGDKSQLMALTFATRYKAVPVLIGITAATALVHAVSVLVGGGARGDDPDPADHADRRPGVRRVRDLDVARRPARPRRTSGERPGRLATSC